MRSRVVIDKNKKDHSIGRVPGRMEVDGRLLSKAIRLVLIEILVTRLGITEEEAEWLEEEVKKRLRREFLENYI